MEIQSVLDYLKGYNGRPVSLKKYLPKVFDLYSKLVWKPETL